MTSVADQLQQMLLQRAQQGPNIATQYGSALEQAAGQDQQSIDQLRGLYNNPANFEQSKLGAFGLGLMMPTANGRFGESMFNGLAAATDVQNQNREANLTRQEKLARLGALEATLTRQKAQDQLGVYDTQGKVIQSMQGDQQTLADLQLGNNPLGSRPLAAGEQGPEAPDQTPFGHSMLVYNDYIKNPQKYAGAQGQAMVRDAIDIIKNERTNQRYIQTAQMRNQGKSSISAPEQRRVSGRLKQYDESADAGREMNAKTQALQAARNKVGYEGTPGAGLWSSLTGWFTDSGAAGRAVSAQATDYKLDLSGKLKGAISDKEQAMLSTATPGLDMPDAAAEDVFALNTAISNRAIEHAKFMHEWVKRNGDDYGADEAWDQYINDNPVINQGDDGKIKLNEKNVANWKDYVDSPNGDAPAQQGGDIPEDKVIGTDGNGNDITWGDILTTAEENNMTPEQVIERLKGGN